MHDNSVTKNLIHFIDQEFFNQVFWLPQNQIAEVTGNLIVSTPDHHPCIMEKKLMSHLIDWYRKQFPVNPKLNNIIKYYVGETITSLHKMKWSAIDVIIYTTIIISTTIITNNRSIFSCLSWQRRR